jgi:chorismate-pyruvate lyase
MPIDQAGEEKWDRLWDTFSDRFDPPEKTFIAGKEIPSPSRELLVHDQHMTVTVEQFLSEPVRLQVIQQAQTDSCYSRAILLSGSESGRLIQFGMVRIDLETVGESVRREIEAGVTPLGRILIEHDVMRSIHPSHYLKITPTGEMMALLDLADASPLFGRLATIMTHSHPAIEVLEVVAPST